MPLLQTAPKRRTTKTTRALARMTAAVSALVLPIVALVIVYLLVTGLTSRTESADRTLGRSGRLRFAATAVVICAFAGLAGNALSRHGGAVRGGIAVGLLLIGRYVLLLVAISFLPSTPSVSWRSLRSLISVLGTPLVFAIAMTTYTVGFGILHPRHRWPVLVVLSVLPGLLIAVYGLLDPMS